MAQALVAVVGADAEIVALHAVVAALGERAGILSVESEELTELDPGDQFASATGRLTHELGRLRPAAVVVMGESPTAVAGALSAHFLGLPVVQVGAGLRSNAATVDEANRRVISAIATLNCAPTLLAQSNLISEGVLPSHVRVTGLPLGTEDTLPTRMERIDLLAEVDLRADSYVLTSISHQSTIGDRASLESVLRALGGMGVPVLFSMHPATRRQIRAFGLRDLPDTIRPVRQLEKDVFLGLAAHARLIVTDEQQAQAHAADLGRPVMAIGSASPFEEAVEAGFIRVAAPGPFLSAHLLQAVKDDAWRVSLRDLESPYDDVNSAQRVVAAIDQVLSLR